MRDYIALYDKKYDLSKVDIFESKNECIINVLAYALNVKPHEVKLARDLKLTTEQEEKVDNFLDMIYISSLMIQNQ